MPGQVIAAYLQSDVVDTTAAAVRAANPAMHWTSDSQVPPYLYQSLCTIMGLPSADFARHIVAAAGRNLSVAPEFIQICPIYYEAVDHPDAIQFDIAGGECAYVNIFFSLGRPVSQPQFNMLRMAELRIRTLLDYSNRNEAQGHGPSLPSQATGADNTIVSTEEYGVFYCKWLGLITEPNSAEIVSKYKVSYIRQFGQSIINIP